MSRNAWIWIVVAIIVIGIALAYAMQHSGTPSGTTSPEAPYGTATDTNSAVLPTGSSTSDASLNTDLKAVDSQMAGFNNDNAAASQSISQEQSSAQ